MEPEINAEEPEINAEEPEMLLNNQNSCKNLYETGCEIFMFPNSVLEISQ